MRKIFIITLLVSLLSSPSWSETLTMDGLVKRNNLYYKKFTDVPFTGEVSGEGNGKFKKGKREGKWISYHENGQLWEKGSYKDGKKDGLWEGYLKNGQSGSKGNYKDGKKDGLWETYYENGQLRSKGNWKDSEQDGFWEFFNEDGSLKRTTTYKNGVKQE